MTPGPQTWRSTPAIIFRPRFALTYTRSAQSARWTHIPVQPTERLTLSAILNSNPTGRWRLHALAPTRYPRRPRRHRLWPLAAPPARRRSLLQRPTAQATRSITRTVLGWEPPP